MIAARAPIMTIGSNLTIPIAMAKINNPPTTMAAFEIRTIFPTTFYSFGKFFDSDFETQNLFAQVVIVHMDLSSCFDGCAGTISVMMRMDARWRSAKVNPQALQLRLFAL